jgi:hypothetical protein
MALEGQRSSRCLHRRRSDGEQALAGSAVQCSAVKKRKLNGEVGGRSINDRRPSFFARVEAHSLLLSELGQLATIASTRPRFKAGAAGGACPVAQRRL